MELPLRRQLNYMRPHLTTDGYTIREFAQHLKKLNSYLNYFPPKSGHGLKPATILKEDALVDIII